MLNVSNITKLQILCTIFDFKVKITLKKYIITNYPNLMLLLKKIQVVLCLCRLKELQTNLKTSFQSKITVQKCSVLGLNKIPTLNFEVLNFKNLKDINLTSKHLVFLYFQ